ncbi:hypothetical protein JQX13_21125 [Archangium violaceum]|nr:hypothetical protein JQX13_21125 [Archangium violaceum]
MRDLRVVLGGELVDGEEALVSVEGEMPCVVVGEVPSVRPVAHDEELDEAQQRRRVPVARVVLVVDDLLHRPPRADAERFQLNLDDGDSVDKEDDVVAVVAVVGVDAELVDDFEGVLAPVLDVDEGVVERGAVVADERLTPPYSREVQEDDRKRRVTRLTSRVVEGCCSDIHHHKAGGASWVKSSTTSGWSSTAP